MHANFDIDTYSNLTLQDYSSKKNFSKFDHI